MSISSLQICLQLTLQLFSVMIHFISNMFKPNYNLTPKLLKNITKIERLYGQLESKHIPIKLELNLERDNIIQSSYISNSIEGNPLSLQEVTNLLLDDRISVNRDEREVKNYFNLLQNLKNFASKEISIKIIKVIHKDLLTGVKDQITGQIRNKKVIIGEYIKEQKETTLKVKHEPPFHNKCEIKKNIEQLNAWLKKENELPITIKAGIYHHQFVYLHPFIDGNGRVCRLLTALIFLQNNYLINKYFVLDDYYDIDRIMYSDMLHTADKGNKTQWLEYFTDGVKYSLQGAFSKVESALLKLKIEKRPTPKEKEVLNIVQERKEVVSTEIAEILNVSRQQAHRLLKALVNKGFLNRKGKTKKSYYYLK